MPDGAETWPNRTEAEPTGAIAKSCVYDDQAAILCSLIPLTNLMPLITWVNGLEPASQRQRFSADWRSRKTMVSTVSRDRQPLVLSVLSRRLAKVDSTGLVV